MLQGRLPEFITRNYECHEWKHASAILSSDYPAEWQDIVDVLSAFRLKKSWVATGGGNKSKPSAFIDGFPGMFRSKFENRFRHSAARGSTAMRFPHPAGNRVNCAAIS